MTTAPAPRTPAAARRPALPRTGGGPTAGYLRAVAAEWTKLWSVRSTLWTLLGCLVLAAAAAAQLAIYAVDTNTNTDPADDKGVVTAGWIAVQTVDLAQFALVALAMLAFTAEYSTGTIRATLQWVPVRGRVLAAKVAVVAAVGFGTGLAVGAVGAAAASPLLGEWGTVDPAGLAGDMLSIGCYLALVGVFTLGLGTVLRSSVGTLTVVFLIFTVIPGLLQATDIAAVERIIDCLPSIAGARFLRGTGDWYPSVAGLGILAAWAAAAVGAGLLVLRRRDA